MSLPQLKLRSIWAGTLLLLIPACLLIDGIQGSSQNDDSVDASVTDPPDANGIDVADARPDRCKVDEHVVANECLPCPDGTTNDSGDDRSGSDTNCDDVCFSAFGVTCDKFEEGYIKASNSDASDAFGYSASLSGDSLAIGAPGEANSASGVGAQQMDNSAHESGAVYVFERTAGVWSQQAYIKASNTGAGDRFGAAVAILGNTLVVAAPGEDSASTGLDGNQGDSSQAADSGAVYVFTRSAGVWSQQSYIKAANSGFSDRFGSSLALSAATLAVGAPQESSAATGVDGDGADDTAANSGAVYVFVRTGGAWIQQAYLKASNSEMDDRFGSSVVLEGEMLVVGATGESSAATGIDGDQSDNRASNSGAAYVFVRTKGVWRQDAYLKASNPDAEDRFAGSLALSGNTIAVGAIGEDSATTGIGGDQSDNGTSGSGAVYVFTQSAGVWRQQAYLKSSNSTTAANSSLGDFFGVAIALSGETLVVGALAEDSAASGVDGDDADNSLSDSGSVYVFRRDLGIWAQQAYVKASNPGVNDRFGGSFALSGNTLAVGAAGESSAATGVGSDQDNDGQPLSGAVYVRLIKPSP